MVKWTDHAKKQVRHIHDYIAQDSLRYAKHVAEELVATTFVLNETPRIGRKVPELNNDVVREIPCYTYRIIYEIKPTHVDVLAVIHKRRELHPDDIPRDQ